MKKLLPLVLAAMTCVSAYAQTYCYTFRDTPVSEALVRIARDHPDLRISFIYKELDHYRTSAVVRTDHAYDALREVVAHNPVSVVRSDGAFYVEALQHGRFVYTGTVVGSDGEPVASAMVMLLAPADSSVITYGVADAHGRFSIPCDHRDVIAKLSRIGYRTVVRRCASFHLGNVVMPVSPTHVREAQVEGQMAAAYADKTVFIPTARQRNASQTGADLIDHIGIPQLRVTTGGAIQTNTGNPVAVFIDYVPASDNDLKAMRMSDVRRVEYHEYPSDPRLQGKPYAVNFIMVQYEYGGYVKGMGIGNVISYSEQLLGIARFQHKKMTYDLMGSGFNSDHRHDGSELTETYRLPQSDGEVGTFGRCSRTTSSKDAHQQYSAVLRAVYNSDNVQASTQISGTIDRRPYADRSGMVSYSSDAFPASDYSSTLFNASRFLSYNGYYFVRLPRRSTLTFTPSYTYSETEQNSAYLEGQHAPVRNDVADHTNQFRADLKYTHDFGKRGQVLGFVRGNYEYNRTRYGGSAASLDRAKSARIGAGANYSVTIGGFYGLAGFGWDWDRLRFGSLTDRPSAPWLDLSLKYAFRKKHSLSTLLHYSTWAPDPSYKSENVIRATHLLSYTGNPSLVPSKSYDLGLFYKWLPSNDYSFSAFATSWIKGDRYVYDYDASSEGILRTIRQPLGRFRQSEYGVSGTLRFLDRSLVLTGQVSHKLTYDGAPYDVRHSRVEWYGRVRYYLGDWNFALTYISPQGRADGGINGVWVQSKSDWYVTVGWANAAWNLRANLIDLHRWDWRGDLRTMRSRFYDTTEQVLGGGSHALIQVSLTYTFGFGRKVSRDNEPQVSGSVPSGILK